MTTIVPGDRVKLNATAIQENGMNENEEQQMRLEYILDNPDEIYRVSGVDAPLSIAKITLDHPILGPTSFFEDEVILIGDDKI